jgi:hypothetical protein
MSSTSSLSDPEKAGPPSVPSAGSQTLPSNGLRARKVALSDVDVAAQLTAGKDLDAVDEAEARRVRRKIDMYLMPLMCRTYSVLALLLGHSWTDVMGCSDLHTAVRRQERTGAECYTRATVR